jgi:hypothetical protein
MELTLEWENQKKKINVTCEDSASCGGKDDSGCEKTKERE